MVLRRIRVQLDQPDRNGEDTLYWLTHLPAEAATASQLAELYRKRWQIEVAFLKMTLQLRCEINTLGYPKAALFGFAVAAVVFNVLAVIMAALRVAHPEVDIEQEVSTYSIANEMANRAKRLDKIIDPEDWLAHRTGWSVHDSKRVDQFGSTDSAKKIQKTPTRQEENCDAPKE